MKTLFAILAVLVLLGGSAFAQFVGTGTANGSVTVNVACDARVTNTSNSGPHWVTVAQAIPVTTSSVFQITGAGMSTLGWTQSVSTTPGTGSITIGALSSSYGSTSYTFGGTLGACSPPESFSFTLSCTANGLTPGTATVDYLVTLTSYSI